jgi:microcompartment protein CcmL/EutN
MTSQALGLIETVGLPPAIEAADAAVKSANVSLLGYEKTRGGGLVTVKLRGDVGAIKAAVEAGSAAASQVGKVFSAHVIARPHSNTEILITLLDRGAYRETEAPSEAETAPETTPAPPVSEPVPTPPPPAEAESAVESEPAREESAARPDDVCNLCGDPACPRRKGQPRKLCIHRLQEDSKP